MDLVSIVVVLIVFGLILWVVQSLLPIDKNIKTVIIVIIVIIFCLWLLSVAGVFTGFHSIRIGR